jgi:hypothetical protein
MNFLLTSILSILAVSVYAGESSSTFSADSCDIISSSSSCSYPNSSSPRRCARELEMIEEQPCLPAVNYMRKLEAKVRADARAWFATSTRTETIRAFASTYDIVVRVYSAFGGSIAFPTGTLIPKSNDFSILRAQALNKGVYDAGMETNAYYAFQMITPEGAYMMVQFIVPRSQLPLNNIKFKRIH